MIADGPAPELLAGGWYFATETARILGGAGGALLPEQGAELLGERALAEGSPEESATRSGAPPDGAAPSQPLDTATVPWVSR